MHRAVCPFLPPTFAGTHYAYPQRDGHHWQAELTCIGGWLHTEMVYRSPIQVLTAADVEQHVDATNDVTTKPTARLLFTV